MEEMLVECLYRVSSKGQVDHDDIPLQRIECRKYAEERGWKIIKELYEAGVSGFKTATNNRDAILELRDDVIHRRFDILLVFMFDRIGRRDGETPFVVEWFVQQGIRVISVCEGEQRIENHTDKLLNYIRYWQSEEESLNTSTRVKTRMDQLRSAGQFVGGPVLYGYRRSDHGRKNKRNQLVADLEIDPAEAAVVQEIFQSTLDGVGPTVLAQGLNKRGLRTRRGKEFQKQTVQRILRNRQYTGYLITKDVISVFVPELQIINEETFEKTAQILADRQEYRKSWQELPRNGAEPLLINGLLYCGTCGHRMVWSRPAKGAKRKTAQYLCDNGIKQKDACLGQRAYSADKVDRKVIQVTEEILALLQQDLQEDVFKSALMKQRQQYKIELEKAAKMLEKAAEDQTYWDDKIAVNLYTKDQALILQIQKGSQRADANMKKAQRAVAEKEQALDGLGQKQKHVRRFYSRLPGWQAALIGGTMEEKQAALRELYSRVEIERGYKMILSLDKDFEDFLKRSPHMKVRCLWSKINKIKTVN